MPFDPHSVSVRVNAPQTKRYDEARDFKFAPDARLDAAQNAFLDRSLRHMIPGMFMREYAAIHARTLFPVYFANDPGAEEVSYEYVEEFSDAEIVSDYASDAPLAESVTTEHTTKIKSLRSAAQWSIQEIRAAAKANRNLQERKAMAARDALLRKENRIAFHGDADFNLQGLFTVAEIPRDTAAGTISAQTAAQNLDMLHTLANAPAGVTNDIESPDTLAIPPAQYDIVATQKLGTLGQSPTVLSDFLEHSPHIKRVMRVRELAGAGSGGEDTALVYERNIQKLRMVVGLDLEAMPPQRVNDVVRVSYHLRSGGIQVHRPQSLRILEGV